MGCNQGWEFAHSLRSLETNERPGANRSGRSEETFWLKKYKILLFSMFYICTVFYLKNEWITHSLFFGERCEWIALVAQQKWVMWANRSGRSPKMSKPWAICSGGSEERSDCEQIAQVAHQKCVNEWIACFFLWPKAFLILYLPNFHWKCCVRNTCNWHLTVLSLLAA